MAYWGEFYPPYVPVAERRRQAAQRAKKLAKGRELSPVRIEGREIAKKWWGKAWCENLECHSDFSNRLPRGRSYVRNGSVIDLRIEPGVVHALVSGTELYTIKIDIKALTPRRWNAVVEACSGRIDSVVELLKGRLADGVLSILANPKEGLFPRPAEMSFSCSCPDWAEMCKHVAATLYGVGARLDESPDLLFTLRKVDPTDLVARGTTVSTKAKGAKLLDTSSLGDVFGIELDVGPTRAVRRAAKGHRAPARAATRKKARKRSATQRVVSQRASARAPSRRK
ncbi:MAG: hypothetical protein AB2A00_24535 [Myxococcota bacterium]